MVKEMQNVYLDEELIKFEGPSVENSEQLKELISTYLSAKGRCIEKFVITKEGHINIRSVSIRRAYLRLIKLGSLGIRYIMEDLRKVSALVLTEPIEMGLAMTGKTITELSDFIELLIILKDYAEDWEWKSEINKLHINIQNDLIGLSEKIKEEDLMGIAEIMGSKLQNSIKEALRLINDSVVDHFNKEEE